MRQLKIGHTGMRKVFSAADPWEFKNNRISVTSRSIDKASTHPILYIRKLNQRILLLVSLHLEASDALHRSSQ
jgi:hypothetical protein